MFRMSNEEVLTPVLLAQFIDEHKKEVAGRYDKLKRAYESDHDILHDKPQPEYKPDNRIVVNFPKYITDTMNGFFIGIPVKVIADDDNVTEYVEYLDKYNDQDDNNAELAKLCSIYGHAYEMYYTDENSEICITYLSPLEAFMIYDDSIIERPLYFVRTYTDRQKNEYGSISDAYGVRHFQLTGGFKWLDEDYSPHYFPGVPATEYQENAERQGIFEPVMSQVNAFNKAISEKANDVDYFADAYLKVLGAPVDEEDVKFIRSNRIVNVTGDDNSNLTVDFMAKPENDTTQENLLNRLEQMIFQISMVANISDKNFASTTGTALKYKLQAMYNLFKTKARKFESGMNRRYKLLFGHPASKVPADSWVQLHYQFTPNMPKDLKDEAETAARLEGIVSQKTQLSVLSIVDDINAEQEQIAKEKEEAQTSVVEQMMFGQTTEKSSATEEEGLNNG